MLNSANDYVYFDTTGVDGYIKGQAIPQCDVAGLNSPLRFEDLCYMWEAAKTFSFGGDGVYGTTHMNASNSLRPNASWKTEVPNYLLFWLRNLNDANAMMGDGGSQCICTVDTSISAVSTLPHTSSNIEMRQRFINMGKAFDYKGQCLNNATEASIEKPYYADLMRRLYWCLYKDVFQMVRSYKANMTIDTTYSFVPVVGDIAIGPYEDTYLNQYYRLVTETGTLKQPANESNCRPSVIRDSQTYRPVRLDTVYYYVSGGTEFKYVRNGATQDCYMDIDLQRDDVVSVIACVNYDSVSIQQYSGWRDIKLEHATKVSGTTWRFKVIDYNFSSQCLTNAGADLSQVGQTSRQYGYFKDFYQDVQVEYVLVRYAHKYKTVIDQQWQWQP